MKKLSIIPLIVILLVLAVSITVQGQVPPVHDGEFAVPGRVLSIGRGGPGLSVMADRAARIQLKTLSATFEDEGGLMLLSHGMSSPMDRGRSES